MIHNPCVRCPSQVPVLLQEVAAHGLRPLLTGVPCSLSRGEDGAIFRTFFVGSDGRPTGKGGTFLEMGAYDGVTESSSTFFEQCLGWRGILVEAQPQSFRQVLRNRPSTLNIRVAACPAHSSVMFSGDAVSFARAGGNGTDGAVGILPVKDQRPPISVSCGPLGDYLSLLGVTRLDYFSLDVEGSEPDVIESLGTAEGLSIGVFQVEVRGDGRRGRVMRLLMERGFSYVGQIRGRHACPCPSPRDPNPDPAMPRRV
jgi:FkbM family methyltransferase